MQSARPTWTAPSRGPRLGSNSVHVWLLDLGASATAEAWKSLAEDERQRARRLRSTRRDRYVSAQHQLRSVLAEYVEVPPEELRFARGAHGKPSLANPPDSNLHFNLSHSRDQALLAVASGRRVGVDLEYRRAVDVLGLARRFFTEAEHEALCALAATRREERFFALWTAKEALGKAAGIGIHGVLNGLEIDVDTGHWQTRLPLLDPRIWTLVPLPSLPGYTTSLAVASGEVELHCWQAPAT